MAVRNTPTDIVVFPCEFEIFIYLYLLLLLHRGPQSGDGPLVGPRIMIRSLYQAFYKSHCRHLQGLATECFAASYHKILGPKPYEVALSSNCTYYWTNSDSYVQY